MGVIYEPSERYSHFYKYIIFGTMTGLAVIYVKVTTFLFFIWGKQMRDIQQRSMRLTLVQSFIIFSQIILSGLGTMLNENVYPCFLLLWGLTFGCLLITLSFSTRAIQFTFRVFINQSKLKARRSNVLQMATAHTHKEKLFTSAAAPLISTTEQNSAIKHWFIQHRHKLASERYLLAILAVLATCTIIYDLLVNIYVGSFSLYPLGTSCKFNWPYYPTMVWIAIHLFVVFPLTIYKLWRLTDAYGIRTDLIVCCVAASVGMVMFLVWQFLFRAYRNYISSLIWFFLAMLVIHTSSVVIPVFRMFRDRRNQPTHALSHRPTISGPYQTSISEWTQFITTLEQPVTMHRLKEMASHCLCTETVIFLEEYQELKTLIVSTYAPETGAMPKPSFSSHLAVQPPSRSFSYSFSNGNSQDLQERPPPTYDQDLPYALFEKSHEILQTPGSSTVISPIGVSMGESFSAQSATSTTISEHELILIRSNSTIVLAFNMFAQQFIMPQSDLMLQVKLKCAQTVIKRIIHGDYTYDMFDEAYKEVLKFLFKNVYPKLRNK